MSRIASPDCLAFEAFHESSGIVVQPRPRAAPRWLSHPVGAVFDVLRARVNTVMQGWGREAGHDEALVAGTQSCAVVAGGYRLVAIQRDGVRAYALFANGTMTASQAEGQTWSVCQRALGAFGVVVPGMSTAVAP